MCKRRIIDTVGCAIAAFDDEPSRIARAVAMRTQVANGASAIQLFDSWAGALSPSDYVRYVMPASQKVIEGIGSTGVPRIHFGVGTRELLELMVSAGADVLGVDWRVPLDVARARVGDGVTLQGNLDPAVCLGEWDIVEQRALDVIRRAGPGPRHIFNLGHGVLPETDPAVLARLTELVHATPRDPQ